MGDVQGASGLQMPIYKLNVQIQKLHSHRARGGTELLPIFGDTPIATNSVQTEVSQEATGTRKSGHQAKKANRVTKATTDTSGSTPVSK